MGERMAAPAIGVAPTAPGDERRRGERMPLHWRAKLIRANGAVLSTITENFSSSGFYCLITDRLIPGEEVDCHISIPPDHVSRGNREVALHCRARVARVESGPADSYGIGCQLRDYQIIAS